MYFEASAGLVRTGRKVNFANLSPMLEVGARNVEPSALCFGPCVLNIELAILFLTFGSFRSNEGSEAVKRIFQEIDG